LAVGKIGILPVTFAHLPAGRMPTDPTAKMAVPRNCELFNSATSTRKFTRREVQVCHADRVAAMNN